jgi:hypothetical protein
VTSAAISPTTELAPADKASLDKAYRLLWLAAIFAVLSFGVGAAWDRAWHVTHPFEDFWSPPHLFIYATNAIASLVLGRIALSAELRRHFGPPIALPLVPFTVPASLALACGGFGVIGAAGFFDSIWHNTFGLDETPWSFPHSMLGSGILLSLLGFVSCRMALSPQRRLASWALPLFAYVLMTTITGVLLGPLDNNSTLEQVQAVARIPVLAIEPEFQHTVRIYTDWNLTRSHPLFVPLSAFAVGAALALARAMVSRTWIFLLVAGIATFLSMSGDRREAEYFGIAGNAANWLPIPFIVPAAVAAALAGRASWAWAAAGLAYAIVVGRLWPAAPLGIVAAMPIMALGALAGARIQRIVEMPDQRVNRLVIVLGIALPVGTGIVDLFLRSRTP